MSPHERDAVSLMGGLLLLLVAVVLLVQDLTTLRVDGGVVAPLVLVSVGAAGLLATLRSPDRTGTGSSADEGDDADAGSSAGVRDGADRP